MLATCGLLLLSLAGLRAQSNSGDLHGAGTIDLEGGGAYPGTYPTLTVHGGADFYTGGGAYSLTPGTTLISNNGIIDMLYEPSMYPETSTSTLTSPGTPNDPATGHCTLLGQTTLTNGEVRGNIPYSSTDPSFSRRIIMTVDEGYIPVYWGTQFQFYAGEVMLDNSDCNATSEFRIGHSTLTLGGYSFQTSEFYNCYGTAVEIHAIDPPDPEGHSPTLNFAVDTCTFDNIRNKCIMVETSRDPLHTRYGQINIIGNSFGSFASTVDVYSQSDESLDSLGTFIQDPAPFGIYIKNFDANANGPSGGEATYAVPVISDNQFTYSGNWNTDLNVISNNDRTAFGVGSSAIGLENTTAIVEGNTISDRGYSSGIGLRYSVPPFAGYSNPPYTYSVICSNTISGMKDDSKEDPNNYDEFGISTSYCIGVVALNSVTGGDIGIESYKNDGIFLLGNSVRGNREGAFDMNINSYDHLAGMGSSGPWSTGAYNTFCGPTEDAGERLTIGTINNNEQVEIFSIEGIKMDLYNGQNNIYYTPLPYPCSGCTNQPWIIYDQPGAPLGNIDGNWWGNLNGLLDPYFESTSCSGGCTCPSGCYWNAGLGSEVDAKDINYTANSLGRLSDSTTIPADAECTASAGYASNIKLKGKNTTLSVVDTGNNCDSLSDKVIKYQGDQDWQRMYDTAKKFIKTCYNDYLAPWMFQEFSAARQQIEGCDSSFWLESQLWLESVLYLNTTNPEYFCACVEAFQVGPPCDTGGEEEGWKDLNKGLAIDEWLVQHTTCDTPFIQNEIYGARASQYEQWLNDTTIPLDTTIPPISSLGLGLDTLLARHLLYASVSYPAALSILSNATANPNPTEEGTIVTFSIAKEAYVKIQLFDVLGHEETSPGFEGLFEPGNHEVPLDLQSLPSGTYFARIMTAFGSLETVKIVKE